MLKKNNKIQEFNVLVVDDSKNSLDRIKAICNNKEVSISGHKFIIKILPFLITVVENQGKFDFSQDTFKSLLEFSQHEFDLILMDFGFRHKDINPKIETEEFVTNDGRFFDGKLLSPLTLVTECKKRMHEGKIWNAVNKNFINYKGNLYIYTFIPSGIETEATQIVVRENNVRSVFNKCKIFSIDSRFTFFNNQDIEEDHPSKYYPHLLSQYLFRIIQLEIASLLVSESKRSYRLLKTGSNIFLIGIVCTGIGIFSGLLSNWAIQFYQLGQIAASIIMPITSIIIISFFGALFLKYHENSFVKSNED